MAEAPFVVHRPPRAIGEKIHDLPGLLTAVLKGRVLVRAGFMAEDEETLNDALEFCRLAKLLDAKVKAATIARGTETSRLELERSAPIRRRRELDRARVQAEEQVAADERVEREMRIKARAEELAGGMK